MKRNRYARSLGGRDHQQLVGDVVLQGPHLLHLLVIALSLQLAHVALVVHDEHNEGVVQNEHLLEEGAVILEGHQETFLDLLVDVETLFQFLEVHVLQSA